MRGFGASEDIVLGPTVQCPIPFLHHANATAGVPVFKNLDSGRRTIRQKDDSRRGKVAVNDYFFWGAVCPEMYSDRVLAAIKCSDGRFKHMKHAKAGSIPAFGQTIAWPTTAVDLMVLVVCVGSLPFTLRFEDLRLQSLDDKRYKLISVRLYNGQY